MNKSRGYYFGRYDVSFGEYSGPDFSRSCFVFPGQGSAFPGMFKDQYLEYRIIREKFELADKLVEKLNFPKVSDYILNPDGLEKETLPVAANLALFVLESALFDLFASLKITPEIVTGHSFGEYAALVASGIISFEEMIIIIYNRDIFCPEANSLGFLMAVNADVKQVKSILGKRDYYISNINSPKQTVIAASKNSVDEIARIFEAEKIKCKILYNVPQPYHSPYLLEVRKKIEKHLKTRKFSFGKPRIPIFSSVLKKLIDENNFKKEDIEKILVNQITTQVDFISQIKSIYGLGCHYFLEIGHKKLFTGFIDDIMAESGKEVKTDYALNALQKEKKNDAEPASPTENKIFSLVSRIIGEVTGYKVEKIYPGSRFQEDLGIDSIKRAEILLTVFDELKIMLGEDFNTSEFKNINDVIAYIEKAKKAGAAQKEPARGTGLAEKKTYFKRYIFAPAEEPLPRDYYGANNEKGEFSQLSIADILKDSGASSKKLELFFSKKRAESGKPALIMRADGVRLDSGKIVLIFKFFRKFLRLLKKYSFNMVLLSSGQDADPYVYGLASFLKSIKKELPGMFFKHVHIDGINGEKKILDIALKEANEADWADVLYKNSKRFTFKPEAARKGGIPDLNGKSVVLAIGGAKGITFSLIKNISRRYKPFIYLAGKNPEKEKLVSANIAELRKDNPNIYYESLNACDIKSLDKLFSKIKTRHKKIDLAINGAGTVRIGFLKDKTDEDIDYEFNNKVLPAFNILELSLKYKPKRIINFSSVISKYGSAGQSIYTSANEISGRLTEKYNLVLKNSGSSAVAVHWPPWDKVGMSGSKGVSQKLSEYGVSLLKPEKADELFLSDLNYSGDESVYYLDEQDDSFYSFTLNDLEKYKSLIGGISDQFGISASNSVFKKTFDLKNDAYLKDHMINGAGYVPAAVGIGMFLCLGKMYFKKFPTLKNIEIKNPVIVKGKPAECLLQAERKNGLAVFSIRSNAPHFYSEAEYGEERKIPPHRLTIPEGKIEGSSFYSDYHSKNSLYLGPVFQSIERISVSKNIAAFAVVNNKELLPVLKLGMYDKLIQWIDASFQTLGAATLKKGSTLLPVGVSRLSVFPKTGITERVYALPSSVKVSDAGITGNVTLVNQKGEAIFEMIGIFLKKAGTY